MENLIEIDMASRLLVGHMYFAIFYIEFLPCERFSQTF